MSYDAYPFDREPCWGEDPRDGCAICGRPIDRAGAGADVRLYLGPGDKLAELWLPLCPHHVERFRLAHRQDLTECRVAHVSGGQP